MAGDTLGAVIANYMLGCSLQSAYQIITVEGALVNGKRIYDGQYKCQADDEIKARHINYTVASYGGFHGKR